MTKSKDSNKSINAATCLLLSIAYADEKLEEKEIIIIKEIISDFFSLSKESTNSFYEQAIDNCGQRDDTDISLGIEMNHLGDDQLEVSVKMTWNEDASLGDPTFNGYVRAYIVEKVSRYNNYDVDPYHFGFLDYAFEESVEL